MKLQLLTVASIPYQRLTAITSPKKKQYAAAHGYEFTEDVHDCYPSETMWDRVLKWQKHLEECDWLFFTGADVGFTFAGSGPRLEDTLPLHGSDLIFTLSHSGDMGIEVDGMLMRNCEAVRRMLAVALLLRGRGDCQNESDAVTMYLAGSDSYGHLRARLDKGESAAKVYNCSPVGVSIVHPRSLMAVPRAAYSQPNHQGFGLNLHWLPGSFSAHLIRRTLEERLAIFPAFL